MFDGKSPSRASFCVRLYRRHSDCQPGSPHTPTASEGGTLPPPGGRPCAKSSVEFLGHTIASSGSTPIVDKVAAISNYMAPSTVRELQQFLGVINFYRKFIPSATQILCLLTNALKDSPSGSTPLTWSPDMQRAFSAAKAALSTAKSLAHPVSSADLALLCDASATHVFAVLQQRQLYSTSWEPLGSFLQKAGQTSAGLQCFRRRALRHFRRHQTFLLPAGGQKISTVD